MVGMFPSVLPRSLHFYWLAWNAQGANIHLTPQPCIGKAKCRIWAAANTAMCMEVRKKGKASYLSTSKGAGSLAL